MDISIIIWIFWLHFLGDFVFQPRKIAHEKSKSIKALFIHSCIYYCFFLFFGLPFAFYAGLFHFIVDFITSKITTALWIAKKEKEFFTVIGLDQAIHMTILILTYKHLFPMVKI